jgi:small-conductance mechanosensitive channel
MNFFEPNTVDHWFVDNPLWIHIHSHNLLAIWHVRSAFFSNISIWADIPFFFLCLGYICIQCSKFHTQGSGASYTHQLTLSWCELSLCASTQATVRARLGRWINMLGEKGVWYNHVHKASKSCTCPQVELVERLWHVGLAACPHAIKSPGAMGTGSLLKGT